MGQGLSQIPGNEGQVYESSLSAEATALLPPSGLGNHVWVSVFLFIKCGKQSLHRGVR